MADTFESIFTFDAPVSAKTRAVRQGKSTKDRILETFDQQAADFADGKAYDSPAHARKAWIKQVGEMVEFTVRMGNTPLDFAPGKTKVYTERKKFSKGVRLVHNMIKSGEFDAQIAEREKARADKPRKARAAK